MAGEAAGLPVIVTLPEEIDLINAGDAAAALAGARDNPGLIIADLTGTTFCDSAGMRMLITAYERAGAAGSTLRVIVTPDSSVARTMTILGIDTVVPVHASIQDAMTAQAPGRAAARG